MARLGAGRGTFVVVALLALAATARANMAAPSRPGDRVSEPAPLLRTLHIVHEDLSIDMREVAEDYRPVRIHARYQVRNDGPKQTVELFFVAPGLRSGQVRHQGLRIPARADARALSELVPGASSQSVGQRMDGLSFAVDFEPGDQVVEVTYDAAPDRLALDGVKSFAIDYVLAPARRWASFGSLNLELRVPHGWELIDQPTALQRVGASDQYRARFERVPQGPAAHARLDADYHWDMRALPADTLRFHIAPPLFSYQVLGVLQWVARGFTLLIPAFAGLRLRRRARRKGSPVRLGERLASFVLTALAIAALPPLALELQAKWYPHFLASYPEIKAVVGTWLIGGLFCVVVHVAAGRARADGPAPAPA